MAITKVNVTDSGTSGSSYASNVVNNLFGSNVMSDVRKAYDNLSNYEWQKNVAKYTTDYSKVSSNTMISTTLSKLSAINDYAANLSSAASLVDKYITNFMNFAVNASGYLSQGLSIFGSMNLGSLMGTITSTLGIDTSKWMEYYNSFKLAANTITDIIANGYNIYNSLRTSWSKIKAISKWNSDDWNIMLKAALYSGVTSVLGGIGLNNLSSCVGRNLYESLVNDLSNSSWNNLSITDLTSLYIYSSGTTSDCMEAFLQDVLGTTLLYKVKIAEAMITNMSTNKGYVKYAYDAYLSYITSSPTAPKEFNRGFNNSIGSNTNVNVSNSISSNSSIILNLPPTGDNKLDEFSKLNVYNSYTKNEKLEELIDRVTNITENIYGRDRAGSVRDFILNIDKDDNFDSSNPLIAILDVILACITIDSNWNRDELGNINYYKMIGSHKLLAAFEKYLSSTYVNIKTKSYKVNFLGKMVDGLEFIVKDTDMLEDIACTIQFEEPTSLNISNNIKKISAPSVNF